jgi:hypothetical protein
MRRQDSPYPARWWGFGLEVPDGATYANLDFDSLPALPFALHGDFGWLADARTFTQNIGVERRAVNDAALPRVVDAAHRSGVTLPPSFLLLLRDVSVQAKFRSNTDCRLDLSGTLLRPASGGGHLVRFLTDSQGCVFWYLHFADGGPDHAVVASPHYYGEEDYDDEEDPNDIVFCADSFETFMARFWLENELWFADYRKEPLPRGGAEYLAALQRGRDSS